MYKNSINSFLIFGVLLILLLGCGSYKSINTPGKGDVERGRLKFLKGAADFYVAGKLISRGVKPALYVNGEEWSPEDAPNFAGKLDWCDTSPNTGIEILRCFGGYADHFETVYILRMKNDEPELQKFVESSLTFPVLDSEMASDYVFYNNIWINDEGRWLLFHEFYLNVETGERIAVKKISPGDGKESFVAPYKVIGISPDMKTIVEKYDNMIYSEAAESFIKIEITDTETGKIETGKLNLTKNPWLTDFQKPANHIQPPPAASKYFVWAKGADGKDQITAPEISERDAPPIKR